MQQVRESSDEFNGRINDARSSMNEIRCVATLGLGQFDRGNAVSCLCLTCMVNHVATQL